MRQVAQNKNEGRRSNTFIPYLLIAVLIFFVSVPVYGIIRDIGAEETVFVLDSSLTVDAQTNGTSPGLFDRIHDFLVPGRKINVPVAQYIDLKGRVVYSNGAPYAGGSIRLESLPRYTTTDSDGYFYFHNVEEGRHTISVIDETGAVLAQSAFVIERVLALKNAELVRLDDGSFVFQVAVSVEMLEITISLDQEEDGSVKGVKDIEIGSSPDETAPADISPSPGIPASPGVPPSGGGGSGGGPTDAPSGLGVYDAETVYGTDQAASVNIFGSNKRIAPGMKGSYRFTVDNTGNAFSALYELNFAAADSLPKAHKIPMRFRLKADGLYVAGGDGTWCALDALYQKAVLGGGGAVAYTLDWYWPESAGDNDFAAFGGNSSYSYSLTIRVTAQER